MTEPFNQPDESRCSVRSLQRGEALAGTASVIRAFLLIEHPGPWGETVLRDAPLPDLVRQHLASSGLRVLLIRRHRQTTANQVRAFYCMPRTGVMRSRVFGSFAELANENLRDPQWPDWHDNVVLVCTHAKHDACCAINGRPVAAALTERFGDMVWETSHLGGDRFAANVATLPSGWYFGRVNADAACTAVSAVHRGELMIENCRGRTTLPLEAQYAELELRKRLGLTALSDVDFVGRDPDSSWVFSTPVGKYSAVVTTHERGTARLTCQADHDSPVIGFDVEFTPAVSSP